MASPERSVFKLDLNELAVVVTTMATIGVGVGGDGGEDDVMPK